MTLVDIYSLFPSKSDCITLISRITMNSEMVCPYCNANRKSSLKAEARYHCNNCNTSYSVTVGTFLHNTKIPLQKWIFLLYLFSVDKTEISFRRLAKEVGVSNDSIRRMYDKIIRQNPTILVGIQNELDKKTLL